MQSTIKMYTNSDFTRGFRWMDPDNPGVGYPVSAAYFTVKAKTADGPGETVAAVTLAGGGITQTPDGWIRILVPKELINGDPGPLVWDCVVVRQVDGLEKTLQSGEGVLEQGVSPTP